MSQVLIVEDDHDLQDLYRIALSKTGREITAVSDGSSAVSLMQNPLFDPHLIILDINMAKGISGLGLLSMLRDNPRLNRVPVVVVTANDLYRDYAMRAGAKAFLVKPVKIADMADLANQLGA
jgi:CheY-like chemotaxis protein